MSGSVRLLVALRTLNVAIAATESQRVYALFSGGGDSIVAAHVASQIAAFDGCVFVDTGTALPGVREHAESVCSERSWPLHVIQSPETYEDMIREAGLPGPGQHGTAYVRLKEKALDAFVREVCSKCQDDKRHSGHDRVAWVSGARADESVRRMGTSSFVKRDGSQTWVNPILDWTADECADYRDLHALPTSDVAALIHRSGECNCGTYAQPEERAMLAALFPEFGAMVDGWETLARDSGHPQACAWGQRPLRINPGQVELMPRAGENLCSDCISAEIAA